MSVKTGLIAVTDFSGDTIALTHAQAKAVVDAYDREADARISKTIEATYEASANSIHLWPRPGCVAPNVHVTKRDIASLRRLTR